MRHWLRILAGYLAVLVVGCLVIEGVGELARVPRVRRITGGLLSSLRSAGDRADAVHAPVTPPVEQAVPDPHEQNELAARAAELRARIEILQREASRSAARRNPYYTAYKQAHAAFTAFHEESQRLQQLRDGAEGPGRGEYEDQLHRMAAEGHSLSSRYETTRLAYRKWVRENPARPDPAISELENELAVIRQRLQPSS